MKKIYFSGLIFLAACLAVLNFSLGATAQDSVNETEDEEIAGETEAGFELTDEELDALLTRVDRFFIDQDMAGLSVDLDIYRDPSNRLNDDNIRSDNPGRIAGLSTIVSHFAFEHPGFYELKIMGEVLAGSDVPPERTFYSQILPMAGAPIYTEDIQARFYIRFEKLDEVDGMPAYKIRYTALDRDTEFFDYIVYYIDVEREVLLRVESSFDNGWYVGTGRGNFYYDEWLGKYLPIYGHGTVMFYPNRRFNVWGRWYRWDWQSEEELAALTEESEAADEGNPAEITDEMEAEETGETNSF